MQKERYQSEINQSFGTICHTEVCLTFLRLAVKLSELFNKFQGHSLKIQPQKSFNLNGLTNGPSKHFEINAFVPKVDGSYELKVEIPKKPKRSQQ